MLYFKVVKIWDGNKEVFRSYDKKEAQNFVKNWYKNLNKILVPFDSEKLMIETRKEFNLPSIKA